MKNLELNIFKLKDDANLEEIEAIINEKLSATSDSSYFEKEIEKENERGMLRFFFYMTENTNSTIKWYQMLSEMFDNEEIKRKTVYSGYGILIVTTSNLKYIITFGRATFLLNQYIDREFGLQMASKMCFRNSIEAQSSKYVSSSKNKALTIFKKGTLNPEAGESVEYLNAKISEVENNNLISRLLGYISPTISFAFSIKVVAQKENLTIEDVFEIILLIDKIKNEYSERFEIPKLNFLKDDDPIINILNQRLNEDIKNRENIDVSIGVYEMFDSELTLMNSITGYKLNYRRNNEEEYEVLKIENIRDYMERHQIENISDVKVIMDSNNAPKKIDILKIIDYTVELNNEYYSLYDGKWARFNSNYIKTVESKIREINKKIFFSDEYNLSHSELNQIRENDTDEICNLLHIERTELDEKLRSKLYREFVYNYKIAKMNNGTVLDRHAVNAIEVCDIYMNQELVHTKIGNPGDFNECMNQSIYGLEMWKNHKSKVREELGIDEVKTVTLLLITKNSIVLQSKDISNFKSFRFKLNLIDWIKRIETSGETSKIIIASENG